MGIQASDRSFIHIFALAHTNFYKSRCVSVTVFPSHLFGASFLSVTIFHL